MPPSSRRIKRRPKVTPSSSRQPQACRNHSKQSSHTAPMLPSCRTAPYCHPAQHTAPWHGLHTFHQAHRKMCPILPCGLSFGTTPQVPSTALPPISTSPCQSVFVLARNCGGCQAGERAQARANRESRALELEADPGASEGEPQAPEVSTRTDTGLWASPSSSFGGLSAGLAVFSWEIPPRTSPLGAASLVDVLVGSFLEVLGKTEPFPRSTGSASPAAPAC